MTDLSKIDKGILKTLIEEIIKEDTSLLKSVVQEILQENQVIDKKDTQTRRDKIEKMIANDFDKYDDTFKVLA